MSLSLTKLENLLINNGFTITKIFTVNSNLVFTHTHLFPALSVVSSELFICTRLYAHLGLGELSENLD